MQVVVSTSEFGARPVDTAREAIPNNLPDSSAGAGSPTSAPIPSGGFPEVILSLWNMGQLADFAEDEPVFLARRLERPA